jgi:hypothetical protein
MTNKNSSAGHRTTDHTEQTTTTRTRAQSDDAVVEPLDHRREAAERPTSGAGKHAPGHVGDAKADTEPSSTGQAQSAGGNAGDEAGQKEGIGGALNDLSGGAKAVGTLASEAKNLFGRK